MWSSQTYCVKGTMDQMNMQQKAAQACEPACTI